MAIVEMKKLKIIGLSSEKNRILDSLQALSCVEVVKTEDINNTEKRVDESKREALNSSYAKIVFAIDFISEQISEREKIAKNSDDDEYKKPKKPFFSYREDISKDDFYGITSKEYELFSYIDTLMQINSRLLELKAERARFISFEESLGIYKQFDSPLNIFNDTKNVNIALGTVQKCDKSVLDAIAKETDAEINICCEDSSFYILATAVLKENSETFNEKLAALGYSKCPFSFEQTAKAKSEEALLKIDELESKRKELISDVVNYEKYLSQFKLLFDYYKYLIEKDQADSEFSKTKLTFVLEGYCPKETENIIKNRLLKITESVELIFTDITKNDNPPTLTRNKKLVAPFENVTNMYSVPNYRENDPNKYMGFFFFLFFGIMLSDAGYGLILTVIGLLLIKFVKMDTGMRKMIVIIILGGISTIFWGILFGGWFGIEHIEDTFLGKFQLINPLVQPLPMLGLCLGVGVFQILFGMGLKAKDMIKEKDYMGALSDIGSWYLIFLGLGLMGISMALTNDVVTVFKLDIYIKAILSKAGIISAILGVLILLTTSGRKEKGFKKVTKGLGSLYGIMNYLSDILSYSRLFGLGLATGVVGMVMNKIGMLLMEMLGNFWGLIPALVIFLVGHVFNIAINVLGAYVHNSRLQYIEFFSRFYYGGGHAFKPFGANLKYNNIK